MYIAGLSCKFQTKPHEKEEVFQNLLTRTVRKVVFAEICFNCYHFVLFILVTTNMTKVLDFQHVGMNSYKFWGSHSLNFGMD